MDSRIVVRLSENEKEDLSYMAEELRLTLSDYVRKKLLGNSLKKEYIDLIKRKLEEYMDGDIFTLKKVLGIHWEYMSSIEKKDLLVGFLEDIENEEIDVDVYKVTKNGKYKFVKSEESGYISDLFKKYIDQYEKE